MNKFLFHFHYYYSKYLRNRKCEVSNVVHIEHGCHWLNGACAKHSQRTIWAVRAHIDTYYYWNRPWCFFSALFFFNFSFIHAFVSSQFRAYSCTNQLNARVQNSNVTVARRRCALCIWPPSLVEMIQFLSFLRLIIYHYLVYSIGLWCYVQES